MINVGLSKYQNKRTAIVSRDASKDQGPCKYQYKCWRGVKSGRITANVLKNIEPMSLYDIFWGIMSMAVRLHLTNERTQNHLQDGDTNTNSQIGHDVASLLRPCLCDRGN